MRPARGASMARVLFSVGPSAGASSVLRPRCLRARRRANIGTCVAIFLLAVLASPKGALAGSDSRSSTPLLQGLVSRNNDRKELRELVSRSPSFSMQTSIREGDGYGGDGFSVEPIVMENVTTVVMLHGLGGNGQEWGYMCLAISYLSLNYVRFILPTAPKRSVTYLDNKKMNSWFDIRGIRGRSRITEASENRTDLMESKERIDTIIAGEVQRGVPPERIFLLGFSQGGALALTAYLRSPFTLGGMLGIATWLPLGDEYPDRLSDKLVPGNIQLHHGDNDTSVALEFAKKSIDLLESYNLEPDFHVYPGREHALVEVDVIDKIEEFILARAPGETQIAKRKVKEFTDYMRDTADSLPNLYGNSGVAQLRRRLSARLVVEPLLARLAFWEPYTPRSRS